MADRIEVDMSEVLELAQDIETTNAYAGPYIRSAVEVTSRRIKDAAAETVRGRKGLGHAASAIDYEVRTIFGQLLQSEIGYNREKGAGQLGNLIEYGAPGSSNQLAPSKDLQRALAANEEDFVHGLSKALEDAEARLRGESGFLASVGVVWRGGFR